MMDASCTMRERLEQTEAYRRVDHTDEAGNEPLWDVAADLLVCLESELEDVIDTLARSAQRRRERSHDRTSPSN